ncbi:uncharacterized protein M421DRAFT_290044 [Didymella exigua CBS 183.55]|uniref:Uncharacterized protein n=1 Tax=Didymella exigua CBS 183.55 TaxID=1150837 RepID=A0A6A5RV60_9PLEO|nr:uncharacterized protein M421DRAFT_290044 [Didymella exigua CBS 183.55]KAF1932355.1 hypothetical protein M421DRAFT_290044 [Didymella exigua CBS 183.55]
MRSACALQTSDAASCTFTIDHCTVKLPGAQALFVLVIPLLAVNYHETAQLKTLFYTQNAFRGNGHDLRLLNIRRNTLRRTKEHVRTLHPYTLWDDRVPMDMNSHFSSTLNNPARLPGHKELVIIGPKRLHGHSLEFVLRTIETAFMIARSRNHKVEIVLGLLPTSLINPSDDCENDDESPLLHSASSH